MPRDPNQKQLNATVTPEQYAVAKALAGAEGLAAYMRRLIAEDATRRSVDWPDNLPPRGGYTKQPKNK